MRLRQRLTARRLEARKRGDGGFTLLEVTTACMLLGLSSASVFGGLFIVIHTSRINADQARVEAVLSSAADRLAGWAYTPCPAASGTGSYLDVAQAAAGTVGWAGSTVVITQIKYFDPSSVTTPWADSNNASGSGCNPNVSATSPRTLQKITVKVTTPSGSYSRQLEVVKNNVIPAVVS